MFKPAKTSVGLAITLVERPPFVACMVSPIIERSRFGHFKASKNLRKIQPKTIYPRNQRLNMAYSCINFDSFEVWWPEHVSIAYDRGGSGGNWARQPAAGGVKSTPARLFPF